MQLSFSPVSLPFVVHVSLFIEHSQMEGQVKVQQERTFRTPDSARRTHTVRGAGAIMEVYATWALCQPLPPSPNCDFLQRKPIKPSSGTTWQRGEKRGLVSFPPACARAVLVPTVSCVRHSVISHSALNKVTVRAQSWQGHTITTLLSPQPKFMAV